MFDPDVYRKACGALRAPQDKIEEIIAMTNEMKHPKTRRHPLRMAAVTAAAVAALTISASAAAPEAARELWNTIVGSVQVGQLRMDMTTEDGDSVITIQYPEAEVKNENGRAVLSVMDQEIDITDELARNGRYEYHYVDEGVDVDFLVEGTREDWTITTTLASDTDRPPVTYTISSGGETSVAAGALTEGVWTGEESGGGPDSAVEYDAQESVRDKNS